jgi:hypothetical protein
MDKIEPEETGLIPERLAMVKTFIENEIASGRIPGAVVGIIRDGKLALLEALMSKPITTAGALLLHERFRARTGGPAHGRRRCYPWICGRNNLAWRGRHVVVGGSA